MAHSQDANSCQYMEIQNLKQGLDASQKKLDRYAHLIATLSDELDNLRNNICYACKKKIVHVNVSSPTIAGAARSDSLRAASTAPFSSTSLWRRIFQGRHRQPRSRSLNDGADISSYHSLATPSPVPKLASSNTSVSIPPVPAAVDNLSTSEPTNTAIVSNLPATTSGFIERTPIPPNPPEWSVVYNPEVKKSLNLTLDRVVAYEGTVYCARFSPDGKRLAVGFSCDGKTYIYDIATGKNSCVLVGPYMEKIVTIWSLQFSPDGQLIVTAASDHQIRVWDIAQKRLRAMFKGHRHDVYFAAFSPDSRFLVSCADDCSVRIWNMRDGSSRKLCEGTYRFISVAFSPDGKYVAAGNSDRFLRIWNVRTNKLVEEWLAHADEVWGVLFTADGKGLVSGSRDRALKHWDVSSLGINQPGSGRQITGGTPGQRFPEVLKFHGHKSWVRSAALSPDNRWLVSCSLFDKSVLLWDFRTAVWQCTLEGHGTENRAVDFSPLGDYLASGCDHRVMIWKYDVY